MKFKVYARTMYCGTLTVTSSGLHIHRNRDGNLKPGMGYKQLRLERVKWVLD